MALQCYLKSAKAGEPQFELKVTDLSENLEREPRVLNRPTLLPTPAENIAVDLGRHQRYFILQGTETVPHSADARQALYDRMELFETKLRLWWSAAYRPVTLGIRKAEGGAALEYQGLWAQFRPTEDAGVPHSFTYILDFRVGIVFSLNVGG